MRIQRSWVLTVLTIITLVIGAHDVRAQSYPLGPGPGGGSYYPGAGQQLPPTGMPSGYNGPMAYAPPAATQYMQAPPPGAAMPPGMGYGPAGPQAAPAAYMPGPGAYGAPQAPYGMQPAAYYQPAQGGPPQPVAPGQNAPMGPMAMPGGPMTGPSGYGPQPEGPWCPSCGGYGCELCNGPADDFDLKLLRMLLPYSAGGICAQRWYDVQAEWVYLRRDQVGNYGAFTSSGISGPTVLSTDNLNLDSASGVQLAGAIQLGAGNSLEASYLGGLHWSSAAAVTGPDDLFSVMSDFGNAPFNGFDDTDRAATHAIMYSSQFNSVELDYRQRWVAPNCRVQGSYLVGVRWAYLDEDFRYNTSAPANPGWMDYLGNTTNSLTGAQVGGDLWIAIIPGLSIGGSGKVGIYGNRATQRTTITANSIVEPVYEKVREDRVSFLGDANVSVIWRLTQHWTLRAGYMFLYMNQVALAGDNFNAAPPFVAGQRVPTIDVNGDPFIHGATFGCEWMW